MLKALRNLFSGPQSTTGQSSQPNDAQPTGTAETSLRAWWMSEFSEIERDHILTKYQPLVIGLGSGANRDSERIIAPDGNPSIKMTALATWFMSPKEDLPLGLRLLRKGIDLGEENEGTILDQHFTLLNVIKVFYRDRANDAVSLDLAIGACEKQILLAPLAAEAFKREEGMETLPAHTGFEQLAIIRERDGDFDEAIRLSRDALRQGWARDWEKRIARCCKKKEKSG